MPISRRGKSKYNNIRTKVDNFTFDSKKEAARYLVLKQELANGHISNLQRQVSFLLFGTGKTACRYRADFVYERDGQTTVEDVKGRLTDVYKLKKKMMKEFLGIEIYET